MRKIPTLFVRDADTNLRYVKNEIHPDCGWVLAGEGTPTRKYDGTSVMFDGDRWWARREVKPGREAPLNYQPIETDDNTGKTMGWEPAEQSGFSAHLVEAIARGEGTDFHGPGTYELLGPKIQGNPEGYEYHVLVRHGLTKVDTKEVVDFDGLAAWLHVHPFEGIVWHHPDGRMAKLKRKDFPA